MKNQSRASITVLLKLFTLWFAHQLIWKGCEKRKYSQIQKRNSAADLQPVTVERLSHSSAITGAVGHKIQKMKWSCQCWGSCRLINHQVLLWQQRKWSIFTMSLDNLFKAARPRFFFPGALQNTWLKFWWCINFSNMAVWFNWLLRG